MKVAVSSDKKKIKSSYLFLTGYSDWFSSDLNSHLTGLPAWLEVYTDTIWSSVNSPTNTSTYEETLGSEGCLLKMEPQLSRFLLTFLLGRAPTDTN